MKIIRIAPALLLDLGLVCSCWPADVDPSRNVQNVALSIPLGIPTNGQTYIIQAGGSRSFVGITNIPVANRVSISFASWRDEVPIFRLTNGEPHTILLWNVRVQVRSTGRGTDGFGWDTVYDDYPGTTGKHNSAHYPPGSTGEFRVDHPGETPWRVCAVYSMDWTDTGKSYSGNYEVISQELKE